METAHWNLESKDARPDHRIIFDLIEPGSKVLDLGCGNGDLMYILTREKNVRAQGIEVERHHILDVLEQCGWKVAGKGNAADRLDLNRSTLVSRMKKLGIRRPTRETGPRGAPRGE